MRALILQGCSVPTCVKNAGKSFEGLLELILAKAEKNMRAVTGKKEGAI